MAGVRGLLDRVRRLEQARTAPRSPIESAWGSLDAFADEVQAGVEAGTFDRIDMPIIVNCIRRWHDEGVFTAWQRDRVWEYGR